MRRTASSTTCCACPTARPSASRFGRWWDSCLCAPPRHLTVKLMKKYPELGERLQWFLAARPEVSAAIHDPAQGRRRRPPARLHSGRNQASPRAGQDARRERIPQRVRHPLAVALPRRSSLRHSTRAARNTAFRICRPNPTPACSAATPTGAARSGCRSTP